LYDDAFCLDINKKATGNSTTFKCTANHTSFAFPADLSVAKNLFPLQKNPCARPTLTDNNNECDNDVNEEASVESASPVIVFACQDSGGSAMHISEIEALKLQHQNEIDSISIWHLLQIKCLMNELNCL